MLDAPTREDHLAALGLLNLARAELVAIRTYLEEPAGSIAFFVPPTSWTAGNHTDVELRGRYAGILIINESAGDMYVGFAPGTGTANGRSFTLPASAWCSLPFACERVSVGGPADGSAVIAPLRRAPASPVFALT